MFSTLGCVGSEHNWPLLMNTPTTNPQLPPRWLCDLPKKDYWSTPFAESLLSHLDLSTGHTVLDIACGSGLPTFHLANRVGLTGRVIGFDGE